jgi:hypothetical protein
VKYFLDTEFNEEPELIELISIGIVAEDGREFYAINHHYADLTTVQSKSCNEWVKANVLTKLYAPSDTPGYWPAGPKVEIRDGIKAFVGNDGSPEFWAYYGDYDWFLVCRLFGKFEKMPRNWPNICFDIKQLARHVGVGNKGLPEKLEPEHNALIDARWTKHAYEFLTKGGNKEMKWP